MIYLHIGSHLQQNIWCLKSHLKKNDGCFHAPVSIQLLVSSSFEEIQPIIRKEHYISMLKLIYFFDNLTLEKVTKKVKGHITIGQQEELTTPDNKVMAIINVFAQGLYNNDTENIIIHFFFLLFSTDKLKNNLFNVFIILYYNTQTIY